MEQKLKTLLGDCMFTIANLQTQLEACQARIKELEDENKSERPKTD